MKITHKRTHLAMLFLIVIWSMDIVTISLAMESVNQLFLLCTRYLCALPITLLITHVKEGLHFPRKKDLIILFLSMIVGDVLYYSFEYTALKYLPVSTVTILLGLLPCASYLTDCVLCHRRPNWQILITILISIVGLCLVVIDDQTLNSGFNWIGYLSCAACVAVWLIYGYLTRSLDKVYSSTAITLYQMIMAVAFMLPFAIVYRPSSLSARDLWICIVLMGLLSSGIGCLIEVKGLIDLGTTISGLYLNLLPLFSAIAGAVFLHEHMTTIQHIGTAIVITCSFLVELQSES